MFAIIQNDPDVPPGTALEVLRAAGASFLLLRAPDLPSYPDPLTFAGVIVLGGAMGVHEEKCHPFLKGVQRFMDEVLSREVPLLGICLGGQLLAHVAGGTVTPASGHGEKGISSVTLSTDGREDPLFDGVPGTFTTFQWHDDSFIPPSEAHLLAFSDACPWQAFRLGASAYGVQFHPEVERAIVSAWSASEEGRGAYVASFDAARERFDMHNRTILANFVRIARTSRRP